MNRGDTFHHDFAGEGKHLWVVLSDPSESEVVLVNFTTLKGGPHKHDPACVCEKTEHQYFIHRSWITYADARAYPGANLRAFYQRFPYKDRPVSPELLAKITHGATITKNLPGKITKILKAQKLIP